jgi:hypothetical protein
MTTERRGRMDIPIRQVPGSEALAASLYKQKINQQRDQLH